MLTEGEEKKRVTPSQLHKHPPDHKRLILILYLANNNINATVIFGRIFCEELPRHHCNRGLKRVWPSFGDQWIEIDVH